MDTTFGPSVRSLMDGLSCMVPFLSVSFDEDIFPES